MKTYKKYLQNVPTIDMLVVGPIELQSFIDSNFTIPAKKVAIHDNFFIQK
jgi:hypothetical protein